MGITAIKHFYFTLLQLVLDSVYELILPGPDTIERMHAEGKYVFARKILDKYCIFVFVVWFP